jgi:hypothetical protein
MYPLSRREQSPWNKFLPFWQANAVDVKEFGEIKELIY